jgi:transcriptional regulator with XRE-family HTH domain
MAINIRLKAARVAKGLTQLQLAERIGLREIEISRIETGRSHPGPEIKRRISEVIGRPTFEIFTSQEA